MLTVIRRPGRRTRTHLTSFVMLALIAALGLPGMIGSAAPGKTRLISVATDRTQGDRPSENATISANGRIIAFESLAHNLVPGDTNARTDIFFRNLQNGTTRRISVAGNGAETSATSASPVISANGRYIAYQSLDRTIVPNDRHPGNDIYVHARLTRETERVSVASDGRQGNGSSYGPSISANGRFVAFSSIATNLVPDDTNGLGDIFVHDRETGATTRVSVSSDGGQGNNGSGGALISADGRYVAFESYASNLVPGDTNGYGDIFMHDRETATTTRVSLNAQGAQVGGPSISPAMSADGRVVAFTTWSATPVPGDTNGAEDVFVRDLDAGTTTRVSVSSTGEQTVHDSSAPALSGDGRFVAFASYDNNLVPGDTNSAEDVFVHDRQTGATIRASVGVNGAQANSASRLPAITPDGQFVAFQSLAGNLVRGDRNGRVDIFVHTPRFVYSCWGRRATIVGTQGNDTLTGTDGPDVIVGLAGDDTISALGDNDVVCGDGHINGVAVGEGDDTIYGGDGNDRIIGRRGDDILHGEAGDDTLDGGRDSDTLDGGADTDSCVNGETTTGCE